MSFIAPSSINLDKTKSTVVTRTMLMIWKTRISKLHNDQRAISEKGPQTTVEITTQFIFVSYSREIVACAGIF